jgi:hypothetical protein
MVDDVLSPLMGRVVMSQPDDSVLPPPPTAAAAAELLPEIWDLILNWAAVKLACNLSDRVSKLRI